MLSNVFLSYPSSVLAAMWTLTSFCFFLGKSVILGIKYVLKRRTNHFLRKGTQKFEGKLLPWVLIQEANCDVVNTPNSVPNISTHFMWMYDSYVFLCGSWGHNAKPIFSKNTPQKKKQEKKTTPPKSIIFRYLCVLMFE